MKKTVMSLCAVAALGFGLTSCGSGNGNGNGDGADTLVDKVKSDSICQMYGTMAGAFIGGELKQYAEQTKAPYDKDDFMNGLESVVNGDKSDAYMAGMNAGMRIASELKQFQEMGVQVDRNMVLKAVREQIMADSIGATTAQDAQAKFMPLIQAASEAAQKRADERKANSPEAVKNRKAAEAYVAKIKSTNKDLKTSKSGLSYVITKPGDGKKLAAGTSVKVKYVGKHIDGKVFDQADEANMQIGGQYVPGFIEALDLLGVGGAGTFYIPGNLAYGVNGQPQANIGPDEMLVFEVEILSADVPAANGAAPGQPQEIKIQ